MHPRLLRHARRHPGPLARNGAHQFAASHALAIYGARAIYTFIPKNGCSTMRLTLGIANGVLTGPADIDWIHKNNQTFAASLRELVTADHCFVILRDPFRRLASCFLDKFVARDPLAWTFQQELDRRAPLDELTFAAFVDAVCTRPALLRANEHWRPQTDFLVFEDYDDWFALERFGAATRQLHERLGLKVHDARGLTRHGVDGLAVCERAGADLSITALATMRRRGKVPSPAAMFTPALVEQVRQAYAADLDLYREKTGLPVLFDQRRSNAASS